MSYFRLIVLLLFCHSLCAQTVDIRILDYDNGTLSTLTFNTCYSDSLFDYADTITFRTSHGDTLVHYTDTGAIRTALTECCESYELSFRKSNIQDMKHTTDCDGRPAVVSYTKGDLSAKLFSESDQYFITIKNINDKKTKYRIIELKEIKYFDVKNYPREYYSMTLIKM